MTRLRTLAAVLALLAPAAAQAQVGAAAAAVDAVADGESRVWAFHIDWGPIKLAEAEFRLTREGDDMVVTGFGESQGLAAMMFDFKINQRAVYAADGARRYESLGNWGGKLSQRGVDWRGDGPPRVEASANIDGRDKPLTPIPPGALDGTVDPAFPIVDVMRRVEAGQGCGGTWRVFDGLRRFDLSLTDEGPDRIEADRDWTYGGPARRCRIRMERIGGFPVEDDDEDDAVEADYQRLLWIAELEDGAAPVRLRVSWPLGYATGRIDLR